MSRLCKDALAMSSVTKTNAGGGEIPLRKRYGQHHLTRATICTPLVDFLDPTGGWVVEIGPGGGVLTRRLLTAGARVIAVEIDTAWGLFLGQRPEIALANLVVGDALEIEWGRCPVGTLVTGNLPFNISTVLIERLLPHWGQVPRAAFLVQKEVGDRLLAVPGEDAYGALSVLTAARARVAMLGRVGRGSFRPPPKVDGVFVGLTLVEPVHDEEEMARFTATVRLSFSQRRKQLRNALTAGWGRQEAVRSLGVAGIDPRRRAEELSLEEYLRLHEAHRQSAQRAPGRCGPLV